jgi:hypothetical protein
MEASRSAAYNCIICFLHNDAYRPHVDFVGMPLSLQDLRGDVVRRSTYGLFLFLIELETTCEPKIAQLNLHILIQEKVAEFQARNREISYSRWMTLFWCR